MRLFELHREVDVSGVSGTGLVAEGVEFTDGTVVMRWCGDNPTTVVHPDIANVEAIHGHGGHSKVVWT